MAIETTPWETVDYLDSEEMILAYLEAAFEDGDPELIAAALNNVACARGLQSSAALSPGADIGSLIRTVKALGLELTAKAA
jgi:DNA-binding phage protein